MTTEQPAPEIGSLEWYRTRPPSVYTSGDMEFRRTYVWTDNDGVTQGSVRLGAVDITFHNPGQVRDLIGQLAALAGEMDAETARNAEVVPYRIDLGDDPDGDNTPEVEPPPLGTPERAAWAAQAAVHAEPVAAEDDAPSGQGWRDEATGLVSGGLVTDDEPGAGVEVAETGPPAEQVSLLDETEQAACPRCGSVTAPKRSDSDECHNRGTCTGRAGARHEEAAQATR